MKNNARKQSFSFLKEYFATYDLLEEPIIVSRMKDGVIVFMNEFFLKSFGYNSSELLGKTSQELNLVRNTVDRVRFVEFMKKYKFSRDLEVEIFRKDRKIVTVLMSIRLIEVEKVKYLVTISKDIDQKKKLERSLKSQNLLLKIINTISARFINLKLENIDTEIQNSLKQVGEFLGVDRCYLFLFSRKYQTMSNTHEWCAGDIEPFKDRLQDITFSHFPWFYEKISRKESLYISDVRKLPPEATAEKEEFLKEGIRSLLNVPLIIGGETIGFLGFDCVRSSLKINKKIINLLRLSADIFANSLKRKTFENELAIYSTQLEKLVTEQTGSLREINENLKKEISWRKIIQTELSYELEINQIFTEYSRSLIDKVDIIEICNFTHSVALKLTHSNFGYTAFIDSFTGKLCFTPNIYEHFRNMISEKKDEFFQKFLDFNEKIMKSGNFFISNNVEVSFRDFPAFGPFKVKRLLFMPAILQDNVIGIIVVANSEKNYTSKDRENLERLGRLLALSVQKHFTERSLIMEKEWLTVTLKSISDGVIATDKNGNVVLMNKLADELTGWKFEEAYGKHFSKIFKIKPAGKNKINEHFLNANGNYGYFQGLREESVLVSKQGKEMIVSLSSALIKEENDNICGYVLVFRDITERKLLETEFLKNQKLESIGFLAGGIAHDFNNLLTVILGNINLAQKKDLKKDKLEKQLKRAEQAGLRARELARQLLTFAKGGAPVKKTSHLKDVIIEAANFSLKGSNVKIEFNIADNLEPVEIDEGQIAQVINNLIINADHSMPNGGLITIKMEKLHLDNKTTLPLKQGNYIKTTISDEGMGIPREHLEKIFDPYFSTKKAGTGLGLATSYSIIKKHGGYISVSSIEGLGSDFSIFLPVSRQKVKAEQEIWSVKANIKGKVLIMDDEELIREVFGEIFSETEVEIEFSEDGKTAIKKYLEAIEKKTPFDLVILDLTIPGGMGGRETLQELKKINPNVRAIVSSGYSTDPIMSLHEKFGFSAVIKKPFIIEEVIQTVRQILS